MTAASERCSSRMVVSGASISASGKLLSTADTSTGIVVVLQDLLRLRAEHQPLDAAAAVRGDEDQVATARLGGMQNGLVRPVARHDGGFVRHAGHPRDHFGLGEDRPRFARHVLVERVRRHHALERADARRAVVRLRVKERHFRAERLGELDGLVDGLDRELRVVERNQQMAIHRMSPD